MKILGSRAHNTSTKTSASTRTRGCCRLRLHASIGGIATMDQIVDRLRFIHRGQAAGLAYRSTPNPGHPRPRRAAVHVRQLLSTIGEVRARIAERLPSKATCRPCLVATLHMARPPNTTTHGVGSWARWAAIGVRRHA